MLATYHRAANAFEILMPVEAVQVIMLAVQHKATPWVYAERAQTCTLAHAVYHLAVSYQFYLYVI